MAQWKITRFAGTAPKTSSELIPDTAAQIARNCKLYSGDLIPYPVPVPVNATNRDPGSVKTLYALRDPDTSELKWLTWTTYVDIATPAADELQEQRFYYTGDGKPKVSTYALATAGAAPFPAPGGYYDLGLPLPEGKLTATATSFSPVTSASFARDSGGNVTLVTGTPHKLKDGALVNISGFTYREGSYSRSGKTITVTITGHGLVTGERIYLEFTSGGATTNAYVITVASLNTFTCEDTVSGTISSGNVRWDIRDLNITTEATVVNDTTLTYYSPGAQVAVTTSTDGKVDLGGVVQARNYLYTWFTPWQEESIGSDPSDALFIREGQRVTVSGLPSAPPPGDNFVRGVRLYRTLAGANGDAEYFRLATLWFPQPIARASRTNNIVTLVFNEPHHFIEDDRFKLGGAGGFSITGGVVLEVVDSRTITYAQAGADVPDAAATGMVYYDYAEDPDKDPARYWGDGPYTFTDDFSYRSLLNILTTNEYDPPPEKLEGLVVIQNNILAGFVGNDIYFTEPNQFHAWPEKYKISLEYNVVALVTLGGDMLVLTEGFPYVISGTDPAVLSTTKLSVNYPCLARRSVVSTGGGVIYATHNGLAVASFTAGVQLVTQTIHAPDTWNEALDPTTIVATYYKDEYFASHDSGSFVMGRNDQVQGYFVDMDWDFTAAWFDSLTNRLYYTPRASSDIMLWDDVTQQPAVYEWKSKTFVLPVPANVGAARVIADYQPVEVPLMWATTETTWEETEQTWFVEEPIKFKFWVDKQLIFTTDLTDNKVFRLPTGYRTDTFEVGVEGTIRLRAIHLAETPSGLRGV